MVKLGFVRYDSTNNGTITSVKSLETSPTKGKPSFPFITSGNTIRDYIKRKIFKATKEEVSNLLKSTSNLNLAGKLTSKSSSKKSKKVEPKFTERDENSKDSTNSMKWESSDNSYSQTVEIEEIIEHKEVTEGPAIISIESSSEIEEPVVEIGRVSSRRFSLVRLSKKKKKARFAEDLTQSLPPPSCSSTIQATSCSDEKRQSKIAKWAKKMKKSKVKPYDPLEDRKVKGKSSDVNKENEIQEPVKWSKRARKFAIRTCRYLGYGAQMISPLTPYHDIPMPVTHDGNYNVYPPYYGSDPYYSYSSCSSVYGYRMSHYGLTY